MTGGLGKGQKLILDALAAIESERGPGACRLSDLMKEAYRRSPLLQAKEAARKTAKEESRGTDEDGRRIWRHRRRAVIRA